MNFGIIFLTGLTVGGLTCLAVQGGLLASVIAAREDEKSGREKSIRNTLYPTVAFLSTKLVAYTILGFLLGAFGGAIGINATAQIVMQFIAGMYMIIIGLNLLNIHPFFRYFVLQPPRFLTRKVRNQSKSKDLFAPAFLGALTIFIPCGTTLAMEALAISSGNALIGAAIMAAFIWGTMPVFFGVGWLTNILGENFRTKFLKIAAIALIFLGITSINGALVASGSPISFQAAADIFKPKQLVNEKLYSEAPKNITIAVTSQGYSPNYIRIKKGVPVTFHIESKDAFSCASTFRIPSLGVSKDLQPNEKFDYTFTPKETGKIAFNCSMGMYRGVVDVYE